ncbi:MAG: sulfite exporter TauE/SafE family protein, partial [Pseudomonadota bacterium]
MTEFFTAEMLYLLIIIVSLACVGGFLAGLLGIGGGLILVPGLYYTFDSLGYDDTYLMHIAIGTSLATIIATGLSSARSHYKRGAVDFSLMKKIVPGLLLGVVIGTLIASLVNSFWLQCFFVPALICLAILMLLNPKVEKEGALPGMPLTAM